MRRVRIVGATEEHAFKALISYLNEKAESPDAPHLPKLNEAEQKRAFEAGCSFAMKDLERNLIGTSVLVDVATSENPSIAIYDFGGMYVDPLYRGTTPFTLQDIMFWLRCAGCSSRSRSRT